MAASRRQPGLWFSTLSVKVEPAKKAHRLVCISCGEAPVNRRLLVKKGSGRRQVTEVYCESCGLGRAKQFETEAVNLQEHLCDGTTPIRLPPPAEPTQNLSSYS